MTGRGSTLFDGIGVHFGLRGGEGRGMDKTANEGTGNGTNNADTGDRQRRSCTPGQNQCLPKENTTYRSPIALSTTRSEEVELDGGMGQRSSEPSRSLDQNTPDEYLARMEEEMDFEDIEIAWILCYGSGKRLTQNGDTSTQFRL